VTPKKRYISLSPSVGDASLLPMQLETNSKIERRGGKSVARSCHTDLDPSSTFVP
jgi:hypothetical protein